MRVTSPEEFAVLGQDTSLCPSSFGLRYFLMCLLFVWYLCFLFTNFHFYIKIKPVRETPKPSFPEEVGPSHPSGAFLPEPPHYCCLPPCKCCLSCLQIAFPRCPHSSLFISFRSLLKMSSCHKALWPPNLTWQMSPTQAFLVHFLCIIFFP